jgi:hypothetical protein
MWIWDKWKKQKNDNTEEIVTKLGCDFSVIKVDPIEVMKRYQSARIDGDKNGYTPVLIIPSKMMVEILDRASDRDFPTDDRMTILEKARVIRVDELLKRMLENLIPEEEEEDIIGEFSAGEEQNHFLTLEECRYKTIIIAKLPTNQPWEAAAWIPMGGFNECPMPEEQVAVFRYWFEKYRAFPALVTSDVWEFYVEQPPTTKEEAELLAWEHFAFCGDNVYQGVGSVKGLASHLINSSVWYFWWD